MSYNGTCLISILWATMKEVYTPLPPLGSQSDRLHMIEELSYSHGLFASPLSRWDPRGYRWSFDAHVNSQYCRTSTKCSSPTCQKWFVICINSHAGFARITSKAETHPINTKLSTMKLIRTSFSTVDGNKSLCGTAHKQPNESPMSCIRNVP